MNIFFPRGKGPLVSVLIPTRGRPSHLCASIDSCYSLAVDKSCMEFVLKIDEDDAPTLAAVEHLEKMLPIKKIISPRGRGYFDMHLWTTQMAHLATGDWLFLFNDDARVATEKWDLFLLQVGTILPWIGVTDICKLAVPTIGRPFANEFSFLRRKTFELLGHIALSPHNDNWIHTVMEFVQANLTIGVEVHHLSHVMEDEVRQASVEAYKTTIESINSLWAIRAKFFDVHVLLNHMEQLQRNMIWSAKPSGNGWYWWDAGKGNKLQHLFVNEQAAVFFERDKTPQICEVDSLGGLWSLRDQGEIA